MPQPARDKVFISYSHKDRDWLDKLQIVLKPLIRKGTISIWDDTQVQAGDQWRNQIAEALGNARVAVLLVSPDFLASDFIADHELPPLLRGAQDGGLRILWVLIRDCLFSETEIADYQAAHDLSRALAKLTSAEVDTALVEIAKKIKAAFTAQPKPSEIIMKVQQEATDTKWVLVAGSGTESLPENLVEVSRRLGRGLADSGFGLVSGGWQGVDSIVARSFAEAVKETEGNLGERLIQFMEHGRTPDFPGGRFMAANSDREAWVHSIERAEAVILVGGAGGTYETGLIARRQGKPVLPVADTRHGNFSDAYHMYFGILDSWNTQPISDLNREDFEDLSGPAPTVATDVIRLLKRLFGLQPQRIPSPAAPRRPTTSVALELWREKLSYLQQQEAIVADPATRFALKKQIEEIHGKINELGG
jgi:TIR domain